MRQDSDIPSSRPVSRRVTAVSSSNIKTLIPPEVVQVQPEKIGTLEYEAELEGIDIKAGTYEGQENLDELMAKVGTEEDVAELDMLRKAQDEAEVEGEAMEFALRECGLLQ